jgi:hypothetical protein
MTSFFFAGEIKGVGEAYIARPQAEHVGRMMSISGKLGRDPPLVCSITSFLDTQPGRWPPNHGTNCSAIRRSFG